MIFTRYSSTDNFYAAALKILHRNELQNNGILAINFGGANIAALGFFLATVSDESGKVLLAALQMPAFNIKLYETDNIPNDEALEFFVLELRKSGMNFPGVTGERGTAERFAKAFAGDKNYTKQTSVNLMRADRVEIKAAPPGFGRVATAQDMHFLPFWYRELDIDIGDLSRISLIQQEGMVSHIVQQKRLFIWEKDGVPVSMAAHSPNIGNSALISQVYTPPFYRNRGYGAAVVAYAASSCLADGKEFCCLFADAENPVSNGIYQKIGFRGIGIVDELKF
ncbi:MAG: GNAT family N-acetyltransferase [Oscillospiraceae bacterium]|jgi:predicted GNAT family acetyltransferase|nr:GNAT family N-acetyltransferase [Oscillospiraceae bacterium]